MRSFHFALLLLFTSVANAAQPAHLLNEFPRTQVIIITSGINCVLFDMHVAKTRKQRSQGLMYIEAMDHYEGMLFLYPKAARIQMWMKNTLIPLDMLFINERLQVVNLHADAVPLSEATIDSHAMVNGVIELNAGSIDKFWIAVGDQVLLPATP